LARKEDGGLVDGGTGAGPKTAGSTFRPLACSDFSKASSSPCGSPVAASWLLLKKE
jgi:hypothetical protein